MQSQPNSLDTFQIWANRDCHDYRTDQGRGFQHDARSLLGNECWLHVVYNWNPESRPYQFHGQYGGQLEHIARETDDIEGDVQRRRALGVPL